jgi:hypothetical protein
MADRVTAGERTMAQTLALVFGAGFLLVGILGFIPGITTDYSEMSFAGSDSTAELLGIFQVSVLHNLVHVLFGIAGLALARTWEGARAYLLGSGIIYIGLWILGLAGGADWIPTNDADHWLHLLLGFALLATWLGTRNELGARDQVRAAV